MSTPTLSSVTGLLPASFGMSSSTPGALVVGERVIMPDDNHNHTPTTPVVAYSMPTPRTHGFILYRTGHINLWGSSDLGTGAGSNSLNSDDQHPMVCTTVTGTTTTGHVGLQAGGGGNTILFSATSHQRVYDVTFMVPILSNGTDTFNVSPGFRSTAFGAVVNGAFGSYDANTAATFKFTTSAASTQTTVDSGVAIVAGQWYRFVIVATNNTAVDFYLVTEGTALTTPTKTINTNIPSGTGQAFQPVMLIEKSAGTTSRQLSFIYVLAAIDRFAA